MPGIHENIQSVSEHQLYKTAAPLVSLALVGAVSMLVTMLLDLENKALKNEQAITQLQSDGDDVWEDLEKISSKVTDLRIHIGNGHRRSPHIEN